MTGAAQTLLAALALGTAWVLATETIPWAWRNRPRSLRPRTGRHGGAR